MKIFISLFCLLLSSVLALSDPAGWRMVDRFFGFRYLVKNCGDFVERNVQKSADKFSCFGWVQDVGNAYAGEARCSKEKGSQFLAYLKQQCAMQEFLVYEDTKIRLHFSSFKVLDKDRDTCFLDEPHKCPEFSPSKDNTIKQHEEL